MKFGYFIERGKLFAFKLFVRAVDALKAHAAFGIFLDRFLADIGTDGCLKPLALRAHDDRLTILILNRPHYIAAVRVLAGRKDIRCIDISSGLLRYLLAAFVREPTYKEEQRLDGSFGPRSEFRMAEQGTCIYEGRKRYRAFLRRLLPALIARHGIDIVFNSDVRYRREADIGRVATELNVPHVCMPRDSMFIIPSTFRNSVIRHRGLGKFQGHQLLVQNEVTRQVFLQSGHARDDQITVMGSIRMDDFIQRMDETVSHPSERKLVLMFTWPLTRPTLDGTIIDLFETTKQAVKAMGRVAAQRPDIDFAVKLKLKHIRDGQRKRLREVVAEIAGDPTGLSNFTFYGDEAVVSELIHKASVICAMQSTTVLEAAAVGIPVILPHFKTLRSQLGADDVLMYGDSRHLFDVPDTEDDLVTLIEQRLEDATVPEEVHQERLDLFTRHIGPLSGNVVEQCVQLLKEYAQSAGSQSDVKTARAHLQNTESY